MLGNFDKIKVKHKLGGFMNIGLIIRGYRKKLQLTQEVLAYGICSVSHLSKIENGSKEVNEETIRLLLNKLDVDPIEIEAVINSYSAQIEELYKTIIYQDAENAKAVQSRLQDSIEELMFYGLSHHYEIILYRYYIFQNNFKKMKEFKRKLNQKVHKFSQQEVLLYNYFNALYFILEGNHKEAQEILISLIDKTFEHYGDYYYHLSLTLNMINNPGASIFYGIKALEQFQMYNNFTRKIHIQMNLAICYQKIGAISESEYYYNLLLDNATRTNNNEMIAQCTHNLSILKKSQSEYDEAISLLKLSIESSRIIGKSYLTSLSQLVETYLEQGNKEEARMLIPEILHISKKENNKAKLIRYKFKEQFLNLPIQEFTKKHSDFSELVQYNQFDDIITYCNSLVNYYEYQGDLKNKVVFLEIMNKALKNKMSGG